MHIGQKIREFIEKKNLSISDFSIKLGKSRKHVYEVLDTPHIRTELLEKVAEALEVHISYFFVESDQESTFLQKHDFKDYKKLWEESLNQIDVLEEKLRSKDQQLLDKEEAINTYKARIEDLKELKASYETMIELFKMK